MWSGFSAAFRCTLLYLLCLRAVLVVLINDFIISLLHFLLFRYLFFYVSYDPLFAFWLISLLWLFIARVLLIFDYLRLWVLSHLYELSESIVLPEVIIRVIVLVIMPSWCLVSESFRGQSVGILINHASVQRVLGIQRFFGDSEHHGF